MNFFLKKLILSLNGKQVRAHSNIKLGLLLLLLALFNTNVKVCAQDFKLNISLSNTTLEEVFNEITKQTEYKFLYSNSLVDVTTKISVNVTNATISTTLKAVFKTTDLTYKISGKQILVSKKTKAKTENITGQVLDIEGVSLPGVSVVVKGTTIGGITDIDGNYSILADGETLEFSFIGMKTQNISIGEQTIINITLLEDAVGLDEVVVTALGIKRKVKVLSYNIQKVSGEAVSKGSDANFINGLAGKLAGVTINSSASGLGGSARVIMRGAKSISKSNNALYVIDGIPIFNVGTDGGGKFNTAVRSEGIADFNPDDIESISVLTGPSAAALYGSNAANGVILITTKKGEKGSVRISISNSTSFNNPFITPKFQNTYGSKKGVYESWGHKLETPTSFDPLDFFQTGTNVMSSVSLSFGNSRTQTFLSMSTSNSAGIIPNSEYNRYNVTFRNTSKFFDDKVTLNVGVNLIKLDNQNLLTQGIYNNPLVPLYLFPRGADFNSVRMYQRFNTARGFKTQYWPYGEQGMSMQNPYWVTNKNIEKSDKERYTINVSLKYDLFDWLNIVSRVRSDNSTTITEKKLYASTSVLFAGNANGLYGIGNIRHKQTYADFLVNINKTFSDYSISSNIGASIIDNQVESFGTRGSLKTIPNLFTINNMVTNDQNFKITQAGGHDQTQSIFVNMELGYKSLAYLTYTNRVDWSVPLAHSKENYVGYSSIGLSFIASELFDLPEIISYTKLRGSFSEVGSSPTKWLKNQKNTITKGEVNLIETAVFSDVVPEFTESYEVGLDFKLFNNLIVLSSTFYKSNTYKQTMPSIKSLSTGESMRITQTGNVENKGVELTFGVNTSISDFKWSTSIIYSLNKNEIIELIDNQKSAVTGEYVTLTELDKMNLGQIVGKVVVGGEIGDLYTTHKLREDNQGDIYVNPGSGSISQVADLKKVGSINAKYRLAWSNEFKYKNFSLGCLISARVGGIVISPMQAHLDRFGVSQKSADLRDTGGIEINGSKLNTEYFYSVTAAGDAGMSSNYVYSATNVRLQELSFSYTLPKNLFNGFLKGASFSLIAKNVFMFYNKAPFDPELSPSINTYYQGIDMFMLPSLKNLGFNIKLNF